MRILYHLDTVNLGGAEILALDVCRNAAAHGIELTFVAAGGGQLEPEFARSGVEYVRLERRLPVDPMLAAGLRGVVRRRRVQIVHGYQAVECLHAWLATVGLPVRRVMSFHGHVANRRTRRALQFLIPRMDANLVVSRGLQDWLARDLGLRLEHRVSLLYNGVDERRLAPGPTDLRRELGLGADDLLLGMVGHFYHGPRKDHLTLCRALPALFRAHPDAHCAFVYSSGQPQDRAKLDACTSFCAAEGIAGRVHFLADRYPARDLLHALDVFVLSSLHEGMPIAVMEAMLVGKPCVLSDIDPLVEVSDGGRCAALFRRSDPADLAARLLELAGDPGRRAGLGETGQRWARERFSIHAHLESLKTLYGALLAP